MNGRPPISLIIKYNKVFLLMFSFLRDQMNLFCQLTTDFYLYDPVSPGCQHKLAKSMHVPLQPVSQLAKILCKVKEYFMISWLARRASDLEVTLGNSISTAHLVVINVKGFSKTQNILNRNEFITNSYEKHLAFNEWKLEECSSCLGDYLWLYISQHTN